MELSGTTQNSEFNGHSPVEIDNFSLTEGILDEWVNSPQWPSQMYIREIHKGLLHGINSYSEKGILGISPGRYRLEDLRVEGEPQNFYVRGTDVAPIMGEFTSELDRRLLSLPNKPNGNLSRIIHDAAWAYYSFGRIHPFLDGNGRTGRMILNRILEGAGLEGLIFVDSWFSQERETHLNALNLVDELKVLAPLELYIAHTLANYKSNESLLPEIHNLLQVKQNEILQANPHTQTLGEIWNVFKNIDIFGNVDEDEEVQEGLTMPKVA